MVTHPMRLSEVQISRSRTQNWNYSSLFEGLNTRNTIGDSWNSFSLSVENVGEVQFQTGFRSLKMTGVVHLMFGPMTSTQLETNRRIDYHAVIYWKADIVTIVTTMEDPQRERMFIRVRCFPVSIHDWQGSSLNDVDREFDRHFSKEKAMRRSYWKGKDTIFKRMDNHDYSQKVTMKMGIFVKSQYLSCMRSSL